LLNCVSSKPGAGHPNDLVGRSVSYAASGLELAGIIERLVDERTRRGLDRAQAIVATVYDVLKETSFRRPSRFQIREGSNEEDTALLIRAMKHVFDKLAQEVELAEHFERVSKHPIYPNCPYYQSSSSLTLDAKYEGNDIYGWDWLTDEDEFELQDHIPWWAPRCVIGYLYIPFQSGCLHLPEQGITDLKQACGGEVARATWRNEFSKLLEPFLTPECIRPRSVYYRLPLLLIGLPRPNRLVPCLYAAISHPTGFHQDESAWFSQDNPIMPCIVAKIGDEIDDDHVFFYEICIYPETTFYVCTAESNIIVIGSDIDGDLWEFTPDLCHASSIDEIPDWLHAYPVQRFLKLTPDSDIATHFALSPWNFPQRRFGELETLFRPSFPDSSTFTQLRPNTIGGYLLRNFVDTGSIFEGLKNDALEKITATKELIDKELSKFQDAFDKRYGRERSQDHTT
jgi:hypothetical protein